MKNVLDIGLQEDFDNMTADLGTDDIIINLREYSITHEGQEGENSVDGFKYQETAAIQELDSKHEVVASGQLDVGDVRVTLKHDTIAKEEAFIEWNNALYKIITITKVRGMNNNVITHVVAHGKKVPKR